MRAEKCATEKLAKKKRFLSAKKKEGKMSELKVYYDGGINTKLDDALRGVLAKFGYTEWASSFPIGTRELAFDKGEGVRSLSASEALYGFVGWLTSRSEPVTMSDKDNAACAVDLVDEFCKANNLPEPRDGWSDLLVHL